MGYDYTFKLIDGERVNEVSYQALIHKLDMADEDLHGRPMSEGGAPQALSLKGILENVMPELTVQVWFGGNQIF